ncbi:MAG: O-antigen ligase family protein [Elusimicrobia bacterium]|nr:O-antigen ligase family protein [Elusimicrobiota bacterium]
MRVFFGIVSFVLLACFLFTFSFLGWLSFLLASLCFVPFLLRQVKFPSWSWWKKGLVIALAVTFAGLFLWVIARKNFWGAFYPRYLYYRAAWELLVARPFGGHGWGTFGILERAFNSQITGLTAFVHNSYLQAWVEGGFLCFLGFVSLALLFVRRIRGLFASFTGTGGEFLALAIGWGLAAFFIDNLFSFTFIKPNIALYGWVMLAVFFAFDHKPGTSLREKKGLPFGSLGILVLCGLMGVVFVRLLGGFFFYHGAKYGPDARIYSKAMQGFSRAGRWDVWSPNISKAAGDLATRAFDMTKDPAYLRQAELQYLEALRRSPYSYAPCFLLGRVYQMLGQNEKSFAFALRARELSPAEFERDIERLRSYEEERRKREEASSPN